MYYGGFTYSECYKIPTRYRVWFIDRINKEFKKSSDNNADASRGAHNNDAVTRGMSGMTRQVGPSRTRRFT